MGSGSFRLLYEVSTAVVESEAAAAAIQKITSGFGSPRAASSLGSLDFRRSVGGGRLKMLFRGWEEDGGMEGVRDVVLDMCSLKEGPKTPLRRHLCAVRRDRVVGAVGCWSATSLMRVETYQPIVYHVADPYHNSTTPGESLKSTESS